VSPFLLLGAISLGLGAAGVTMGAFRLIGRRAPRWAAPLAAGVVMFSFYVWMEYTWFPRLANQLSERIVVVETHARSAWWQPWSLLRPQIVRFTAIDGAAAEPVGDGLARVELWLVDRYTGSRRVTQLYDCAAPRRLDLTDATRVDGDGVPEDGAWRRIAPDDAHRRVACRLVDRPLASAG